MAEISVTFKDKTGASGTWRVFHGTVAEVTEDIAAFFSIPEETAKELGPSELVDLATKITHGQSVIVEELGATPTKTESKPARKKATKVKAEEPAEEPEAEDNANADLIQQLEQAASLLALKTLWAANKAAFKDKAVQAAYKERHAQIKATAS